MIKKIIKTKGEWKKISIIFGIFFLLAGAGCATQKKVQSPTGVGQPAASPAISTSSETDPEVTAEEQPVSKNPWPQFHGNARHTGYAPVTGPAKAALKWKFSLGELRGGDPNSIAISADGTIYVAGASEIFALDKNGKKLWSKKYQGTQGPALAEDGTLYFVAENSIIALDKDGKEKWKFKTGGMAAFGPTVGADGIIYQGSWDGYFYALNRDGSLKWKYKTAGSVSYPSSIGADGTIYLGGGDAHSGPDGNLYAFSPDGSLKWKYNTGGIRVGSPAIAPDGLIYVAAAPSLFVLNSAGKLQWKKGPAISFFGIPVAYAAECGAPPLPACNGTGIPGGDIPSSSGDCGAPPLPPCGGAGQQSSGQCGAPPLPPCNMTGPQNGKTFEPPINDQIAGIITPAIAHDGTIYIGNAQGVLSAVNPKTQEVKWTYQTGVDPKQPGFYGLPSFPLVDSAGTVYFGSVDGKMYAVDKDGKLVWSYQTGAWITEASPAFGADGTLYFTSKDGYLYAIGN